MIYKVIFRQVICFQLDEIVHVCMNYISLSKERFFIITATHPAIVNVIIDFKTSKIAMFVNPTDKTLKITKRVRLNIIYKYIDVIYIIIDIFRAFTILIVITVAVFSTEPFILI